MTHHAHELRLMADDPELSTPRREAVKWALDHIRELEARVGDLEALVEAGNAMADSIKGSYILPGSATAWYAAIRALKGQTDG